MTDPNGRFRVLESLPAAPGECFVCKSIRQGPFVDTGISDPYLGVFYVCKGCLTCMINELPDQPEPEPEPELSQMLDEARNDGFLEGIDTVKSALDDLARLFVDQRTAGTISAADAVSSIIPASVPGDSEGQERDGTGSDSVSKQGSRTSKREGRNDVPSVTGDGAKSFDLDGI